MGWASGFRAGSDLGNNIVDNYNKGKIRRGLAKVDEDYETVSGRGLKVTDAQGNTSDAVIDPAAGADYDTIRQQYEQAGYKVDYADAPQYAARSGEGRDAGVYGTEAGAESAARKQNYGLARQRADVYEQYGNPEMARGLRRDAQQLRMEDQKMDMATEAHGLQMQEGRLRVNKAQDEENARQRIDMFTADFNQLKEQGALPTVGHIRQLMQQHGLTMDEQLKVTTGALGIDANEVKMETMERLKLVGAAERAGPEALNKLFATHPMFADGRDEKIVQTKNGFALVVNGKPEVQGSYAEVAAYLRSYIEDPIKAVSFKMEVDKYRSSLEKDAASASADRARGRLYDRTDPNMRSGGVPPADRQLGRLQAQEKYLAKQLSDAREALAMYEPGTAQYNQILAQHNAIADQLFEVEQSVGSALGLGRPEPAAPAAPTAQPPRPGGLQRRPGAAPAQQPQPRGWNEDTGEYEREKPENVFQGTARWLRGY